MKTARQILEAIGCKIYADEDVLEHAPIGKVQPVIVFKLDKYVTCQELENEYAARGLSPAGIASIAAIENKPEYLASQWKDAEGNYCCVAFHRWLGGRDVDVRRYGSVWHGRWSFAGVPQVSSDLGDFEKLLDTLPLELEINGIKYRRV